MLDRPRDAREEAGGLEPENTTPGPRATAKAIASEHGLKVLPLAANKKFPPRGFTFDRASSDPAEVERLFSDALGGDAGHNVAIMTGEGIIVIDVDNKGEGTLANYKAMTAKFGKLPRTVQVQTPSGGRHFYFRVPPEAYIPNTQSKISQYVDVRGHHGLVAAPGSSIDGKTYIFATGGSLADLAIADLPEAYRDAMTAQRPRAAIGDDGKLAILGEADTPAVLARAAALAREWPEAVEGAGGHPTTIDLAHKLMDLGCRPETAAAIMGEHWDERNAPPWGDDDLCRLVLSLLPSRRGPIGCAAVENVFEPLEIAERPASASDGDGLSAARLPVMRASDFEGRPIPPRSWIVPGFVPDRTVSLFAGDGGAGKTMVALQLAIAVVTGREWLGMSTATGPALFLSAEDDTDELHRRVAGIAAHIELGLADLSDLHMIPLAGLDAVLATAPNGKAGNIAKTPLWRDLVALVDRIKPRVVFLDTLADVFAGDEIARQQARQFIGQLRGLAIGNGLAVLLLAHPSQSGMSSGSGTSGSTGWSNSVRSRLYLEKAKNRDGREIDGDLRSLTVKKANYGPDGQEIRLRWAGGCFDVVADRVHAKLDRAAADAECERVFLDLLAAINGQGREASPNASRSYAPTLFAGHPEAEGFGKRDFELAMERLLSAGRIRVEKFGPPSKQRSRLARGATGAGS